MRRPSSWSLFVVLGACSLGAAVAHGCSPTGEGTAATSSTGGDGGAGAAAATGAGGSGSTTTSTGKGAGVGGDFTSGVGGGTAPCKEGLPDEDGDGDGFTEEQGDCNDCDAFVNPNAIEVIAEPDENGNVPPAVDENCDGQKDNVPPPCDDGIVQDTLDPMEGAKAIGLCSYVKKASWVQADGSPPPVDPTQLANFHLGHGVLDNYGPNNPPREGKRILVLSSGTARKEGDPEYVHRNFEKGYVGNPPPGFPKESPSCPAVKTEAPHDATGLELEITAPSNALGFSFDFNFFTFEWPQYICTYFNDFFVANLTPFPAGQSDGNISFDNEGNPISVNNAFLDVCGCPGNPPSPCTVPPDFPAKSFACAAGPSSLSGTPFDTDDGNAGWSNGSTAWLRTSAPIEPGQTFTIRFVTYDSSDGNVDSTTLIDNWTWIAKPGTEVGTRKPPL